jgi:hypothetical protein
MDRRDEASSADYKQLRRHVVRKAPEHPAGRQAPCAPAEEPEEPEQPEQPEDASPSRFSVMEWLVAVGHAAVRKLRRAQGSAMVRVHPKE